MGGFALDRVEVREGETVLLQVPFDAVSDLRHLWYDALTVRVGVRVLEDEASAEDLLAARGIAVYGYGLGRTEPVSDVALVTIRAWEDDLAEGPERLRLRLTPDDKSAVFGAAPIDVGLVPAEIEVVIRDGEDQCSGIRLSAAAPRRVPSGTSCQRAIHTTDITIEADGSQPLQMGSWPASRIVARHSQPAGSRVRHSLTVEWRLGLGAEQEFRFQPCQDPGQGPTLICSNRECEVYEDGEDLPDPQPPICSSSFTE